MGLAGGWRDQVWEALGENATRTGWVPTEEFPSREPKMHGARPPWEVRQVALMAAGERRFPLLRVSATGRRIRP
jgi:hypothetical protein